MDSSAAAEARRPRARPAERSDRRTSTRRILAFACASSLVLAPSACSSRSESTAHTGPPRASAPAGAPSARVSAGVPIITGEPTGSSYLGRELAEPMSYLGADWLERADREETEKPEHVLDVIGIAPGQTVADVGAGSGYFTVRLAKRLGKNGRVLATDLQPEMLALVRDKIAKGGLSNVETVLATPSNANLPKAAVDLVLMVDVYHELPRPAETLAQVKDALRAGGRLVLVEYRAEDPRVPIKEEHKMTLAQIEKELSASAFQVVQVDESLPWQRIVIARPASH